MVEASKTKWYAGYLLESKVIINPGEVWGGQEGDWSGQHDPAQEYGVVVHARQRNKALQTK